MYIPFSFIHTELVEPVNTICHLNQGISCISCNECKIYKEILLLFILHKDVRLKKNIKTCSFLFQLRQCLPQVVALENKYWKMIMQTFSNHQRTTTFRRFFVWILVVFVDFFSLRV